MNTEGRLSQSYNENVNYRGQISPTNNTDQTEDAIPGLEGEIEEIDHAVEANDNFLNCVD